jgi:hypothetical protein
MLNFKTVFGGPYYLTKIGALLTAIAGGILAIAHPDAWTFPLQIVAIAGTALTSVFASLTYTGRREKINKK